MQLGMTAGRSATWRPAATQPKGSFRRERRKPNALGSYIACLGSGQPWKEKKQLNLSESDPRKAHRPRQTPQPLVGTALEVRIIGRKSSLS